MTAPEPQPCLPVELTVPSDPKWLTVVRLTVSGVAARLGASYEDVDDIKVAVSEACTNVIDHAFGDEECETAVIRVSCVPGDEEITISVQDEGCGFDLDAAKTVDETNPEQEGGLGLFLIRKLMDDMEVVSRPGGGTKVVMVKRFAR